MVVKNLDVALNILAMANSQMVQKCKSELHYKIAWDCCDLACIVPINHGNPVIILTTNASEDGWGACLNGVHVGGRFTNFLFGDNL